MKLEHGSRGEVPRLTAIGIVKDWIAAEINCDPERIEITGNCIPFAVTFFCHDGTTTETGDDAWPLNPGASND